LSRGPVVTSLQRAIGIRGATALAATNELDVDSLLRFDARAASSDTVDDVFTELARRVATAVATPLLVLDPGLVVLAGSVVRDGGTQLLDRVRAELAAIAPVPVRIALSETGPDAILAGAMSLALDHARDGLFEPADDVMGVAP
jgi:predicted NBD/HSP70 family sugar kinase